MRVTPVIVQTMLHIYGCPQPLRDVPAVSKATYTLGQYGLIESVNEDSGYRCTDRGLCWVNMLLGTPLPIEAYLDPRNGEAVSPQFRGGANAPPPVLTDGEGPVERGVAPSESDLF